REVQGGWKVRETGRQPFVPVAAEAKVKSPPDVPLRLLGNMTLRSPIRKKASRIREIILFTHDGKSQLAFLRMERNSNDLSFVRVGSTGNILCEIRLDALDTNPDKSYEWQLAWC